MSVQKYKINENGNKHNLVVTLTPEDISFNTIEDENVITLVSEETKVEFNQSNGQITFYDRAGNPTLCEKQDAYMMTERKDGDFDSYRVSQTFTLQDEEQIYGLVQLMNGDLSQRGKSYWDMIQGNMSVLVPYIHSVKGYALYWYNYSPTNFTDNDNGMTFESAVGYGVNYYYL